MLLMCKILNSGKGRNCISPVLASNTNQTIALQAGYGFRKVTVPRDNSPSYKEGKRIYECSPKINSKLL